MESEQMEARRQEYFDGKAIKNRELWERMQDTSVFFNFMEALDEEQRERVGKFFARAVDCLMVQVRVEDEDEDEDEDEGRYSLSFNFPMESGRFVMFDFSFFIRSVLNPRGDKKIPYNELCELFPQTYDWVDPDGRMADDKKVIEKVKGFIEDAWVFPCMDEEIIELVFFDTNPRIIMD